MRKDDYVFNVLTDGRRFVVSNVSRLTKNHSWDSGNDNTNVACYEQRGMYIILSTIKNNYCKIYLNSLIYDFLNPSIL